MFKKLALVAIICVAASCSSVVSNHRLEYQTSDQTLEINQGKWLLGFIEGPTVARQEMIEKAKIDLNKMSENHVDYVGDVNLLMPEKTPMNPSKLKLSQLRKGTGYDYFVNIHCKGNLLESEKDFVDRNYVAYTTSLARVVCEVYDLKKGEIVYRQSCQVALNNIAYGNVMDDMRKRIVTQKA